MRQTMFRGAVVGAAITVPLGVLAGVYLRGILFGETRNGQSTAFVVLVTFCFLAWGVAVGAMLSAERRRD